jgi:dehydratase
MKPTHRAAGTRLLAGIALATVPLLGLTPTAAADTQAVTYHLRSTAAGQTADSTMTVRVAATQPATVAPNGPLTVALSTDPITVPGSANGYTIRQIQDLALVVPVPANAVYGSCALSGGDNLGSGTPSCAESGGKVTVNVPGPLAGGSTATLPTLTLNLTAGDSGTVDTRLGGSSYSDPGLSFTAVVQVLGFPVNAPTGGYPDPNPVLASTTIG